MLFERFVDGVRDYSNAQKMGVLSNYDKSVGLVHFEMTS